jgi:hypothetical protein
LTKALIEPARALAILSMLVLILSCACTRGAAAGSNARPLDFYAAGLPLADVRSLLGDSNWWPGPPSFGVRPLNAAYTPFQEKFTVVQRFVHIGTAETFDIEFAMWATTSAATTQMTTVQTEFGTPVAGPKAGDQVLYYGSQITGAAPYATSTIVRVGQILSAISWTLKGAFPAVAELGKIAVKVASRVKDLIAGKVHGSSLAATDSALLPPASLDMTLLGSARIPIEAAVVMIDSPSLQGLAQTFHNSGVDDIVFGDYALNNDTHMEVRASVFGFSTAQDATAWLDLVRGTYTLDPGGIAAFYDPSLGEYYFLFAAGTQVGMLICRSTSSAEAASRACEAPLSRVTPVWKLSLGG